MSRMPNLTQFASMCRAIDQTFSVIMHADSAFAFVAAPRGSNKPLTDACEQHGFDWHLYKGSQGVGFYFRLESL